MAGELTISDWSGDNLPASGPTNFANAYRAVILDTVNSDSVNTGVKLPAAINGPAIGIVYEKSKLDPSGNPVKNSGVVVRSWGIARVEVSAATAVNDLLRVADSTGRVSTIATSASWQNIPIVGIGLTATGAAGDRALVLLTTGVRI